jgi:hypothetical protein
VTHCLYDEGVAREAGFGARAASTRDPLLLRFAAEYPLYERPLGADDGEAPPRRLALVRVPGGRTALIHSVPLPRDDRGRSNNFFSHVIFADGLAPREALAAWGSPEWAVDYPPGADREIPPLDGVPRGEAVGDRALTSFLGPSPPRGALTCPQRLTGDQLRRRELLALVLRGCVLALQAGPAAPRGRFYVRAEPGLVALLLYGAARLLPHTLAAGLTFSTYESALTALRSYRHAQVVGTWITDPRRGLDADLFAERGYALDTVNHRFSEELGADQDPALDEWIELAARGEWATIDRLHGLLVRSPAVVSTREAVQAARLARRLSSGSADAEDLLALKDSPWGAAVLAEHRDEAWPIVRDGSLTDARLRDEFADLVREHLPELEARAARALRDQPAGNWQPWWRVLWAALQDFPARLRETCERILPEPPYPPALCFAVLEELKDLRLSAADPRVPLHALLKGFGAEELDQFARSALPREWFVWAVCYALLRPEARDDAARHLHDGGDELARVFWQQFRLLKDEGQRRAILTTLVVTAGDRAPAFLHSLLACGCAVPAATLAWLLETMAVWDREWDDFWGRDDHLGRLLARAREFGEEAAPVWERFCARIDRGVLPPGDPNQQTLLTSLVAVCGRPGPALPTRASEAVADWALLRDHFEKASAVQAGERAGLIAACNRRQLDPLGELAAYFARFVRPQPVRDELLDDFAGFFNSFYPEPAEYPDHGARWLGWLQVVAGSPDEVKKASYQNYYLHHHVAPEFRRRLAEETHRAGQLLPAVYESAATEAPCPPVPAPAATTRLRTLAKGWAGGVLLGVVGGLAAAALLYLLLARWLVR